MPHVSSRSTSSVRLDHVRAGVKPGLARIRGCVGALVASVASLLAGAAPAAELLVGTAPDGDDSAVEFRLEAENRKDLVGGRIFLGESEYEISRVSRLGLVGARRFVTGAGGQGRHAEFLVFASSYSEQTAVGKPLLAARAVYGCDRPYNTYLGFYRVEGEKAVKSLGPIPYPDLVEDLSHSHHSHVSCFMAHPPG